MPSSGRWRTVLLGLAVALAYFALAGVGHELGRLYEGYAPFWPAAGAASGALVVLGRRFAPAIALGSLCSGLVQGFPAVALPWFVAVDTGEALLVATLIHRAQVAGGLRRPRDVIRLGGAGILGGAASASLAGPVYAAIGMPGSSPFWPLWLGWMSGNAIAHLVIGGTWLVWSAHPVAPLRATRLEQVAVFAGTLVVSGWIFLAEGPESLQRPYLVLALVTWTAVRLGQRAVSLAVLASVALAAAAVTRGTGPFSSDEGVGLQVFLAACGLAGFAMAAVAAEREDIAGVSARDARYRVLADASPNLMWSGSASGAIHFFNQQALTYTGLPPERAGGMVWMEVLHPDDTERAGAAWRTAADAWQPCALELRVRRADGVYRWHWVVVAPTVDAPGAEPDWIGTATDIHDRKLAELELTSWRTHYERAQAVGQLGSWESDLEGLDEAKGQLVWSSELFRVFGVTREQFDGRVSSFYAMVHPEDRAAVREAVTAAVTNGTRYAVDHRIVRPDGEVRWVHEEADVTTGLDGKRRLVGICRDITDRVRAEELERSLLQAQKLESLGILTGGIAHDFNNLLVGILGNASLALLDLPADSNARPAVERIETTSLRAADLIRQMLAYAGKSTLSMEPVDLSSLVREMGGLLGTALSKKTLVRYQLADDLPPVAGDPTQLRQVVMNLMTNASEALHDHEGTITIATRLIERSTEPAAPGSTTCVPMGRYVQITVADSGVGMDQATQSRIFEPFFTTKFTGRGLGLAAVQGIVRSHRGSIDVESAPGRGTTFTVQLPAEVSAARIATPAAESRSRMSGLFSGTALVIDDEDAVRVALSLMLERFGFSVVTAGNGRQGLEQFATHGEDVRLVVLDLTMPDMSGAEVLSALRRLDAAVPVLLVSGYGASEAARAAGTESVSGFLQKPFKPQELAEAVAAALVPA